MIQSFCHTWKDGENQVMIRDMEVFLTNVATDDALCASDDAAHATGDAPFALDDTTGASEDDANEHATYASDDERADEEFLKWFCLNNQTKKKVLSDLNFKGAFKPENRAIIQGYLGISKTLPRDRISKILLMKTKSVDEDKADELESIVKKRDSATRAFVADERVKIAAERAAERERQLRGELGCERLGLGHLLCY